MKDSRAATTGTDPQTRNTHTHTGYPYVLHTFIADRGELPSEQPPQRRADGQRRSDPHGMASGGGVPMDGRDHDNARKKKESGAT